jgi:hypothetical protein
VRILLTTCPVCQKALFLSALDAEQSASCSGCSFFAFVNRDVFTISGTTHTPDGELFFYWSAAKFEFWSLDPYQMHSFDVAIEPTLNDTILVQAEQAIADLVELSLFA